MAEPKIMYAHRVETDLHPDGVLMHVTKYETMTGMYDPGRPIVKVTVREVEEGNTHWGWQDTGSTDFEMVYPSKCQSDMCFAYGVDAEVKAGRGRQVKLLIEEVE